MPVSESLSNILTGVEEMKKRALKGTPFEDEETQKPEPEKSEEACAAPDSKPGPVKHEAATPRVCKKELRSPGIPNIAGVADLQAALTAEAAVPPTLPTSPTSASKKRTPRSSRRKRGSSRTPKDRTPEANFETPETKPSSRTPEEKAPEEEPSTRTPDEKAPEKPSIRTPKDKAPEKPSSRTPKEKAPEKPSIRTPKEKAPEAATPKARTPCSGKRQKSKSPAAEKEVNSLGAWSVNSSGTWASDGSDGWGWDEGSWGSSWDDWSWSNDQWRGQWGFRGSRGSDWSGKDWGYDHDHEAKPAAAEDAADDEAARVNSILKRGHTVDQLSLDELKTIVNHVDSKQRKIAEKVEAEAKPQADSADAGQKNDESKKEDAKQEEAKESEEKVPESKEQRKKRLHARNMRFYRSFESPNCPKEIKKLSKQASGDSSKRSFLFENWLTCQECWMKSSLLQRLRSKNSNAKRGLRRWLTKAEMEARWGAEIAKAMVETKESDEEKAMTEIRPHPELPDREDKCI
ncbi:unnamed protein product [Symbiodinium microadriaticum]|nr:unnamed protein product [Symbiodinium microadriaticum]CAE7636020.1 unnamed protein product [Symbiodinium sp. KB8]